jgi:putative tryptophan/tyrosine transport system substrate-binding protein
MRPTVQPGCTRRGTMRPASVKRSFFLSFVLFFLLCGSARAEKRIGILLFSDDMQDAVTGVLEQLRSCGFKEPAVKYLLENAKGNKAKVAELAHKFAKARLDLIVTVGTSATVPIVHQFKDIPVVFSMVYDPVEAKIAESWQSSGNNSTGTTARVSMPILLGRLNELVRVKRLAVLYTPGEKNSESQLMDLQRMQKSFGLKVVPVPLTGKGEAAFLLPEVLRTSDAIYLTGSNVVNTEVAGIVESAGRAHKVTVTHFQALAQRGVLLSVSANTRELGRLAGEKAVKILRGAKPSSIPIEGLKKYDLILNMRTAKAGNFLIPPSLLGAATRIIQ